MTVTTKKPKLHYVDNEKFLQCIRDYKHKCLNVATEKNITVKELVKRKENPQIPNFAGDCIQKIAKGLSYSPKFISYSFKEEMISDGIENAILYFDSFDPERGLNPFSYFTQVIYYAFLRRIAKEEKIRYTAYKYFDSTMMGTESADLLLDENDKSVHEPIYDNISRFIEKYEEKDRKRREKKKAALEEKKGLAKLFDEEEVDTIIGLEYPDVLIIEDEDNGLEEE